MHQRTAVAQFAKLSIGSLLLLQFAFPCTIVEVEVPPQKVNRNVTVAALQDDKPIVAAMLVVERLGDPTVPVTIAQVSTNAKGEIVLRELADGTYTVSVLEGKHKHWLGAFEVMAGSSTDMSHAQYKLLPEPPPPTAPPAPLLLRSMAGQLLDPSGAVFANTRFKVRQLDAKATEIESSTNASGEFSLGVPDGHYELSFAITGFNPAIVPVKISANSGKGWNGFTLKMALAKCGPGMDPYRYSIAERTTN